MQNTAFVSSNEMVNSSTIAARLQACELSNCGRCVRNIISGFVPGFSLRILRIGFVWFISFCGPPIRTKCDCNTYSASHVGSWRRRIKKRRPFFEAIGYVIKLEYLNASALVLISV
jgi:hypothetical protein